MELWILQNNLEKIDWYVPIHALDILKIFKLLSC